MSCKLLVLPTVHLLGSWIEGLADRRLRGSRFLLVENLQRPLMKRVSIALSRGRRRSCNSGDGRWLWLRRHRSDILNRGLGRSRGDRGRYGHSWGLLRLRLVTAEDLESALVHRFLVSGWFHG